MEKQLGWTTIEQSKKLIEAGLDPNTADMCYESLGKGLICKYPTFKDIDLDFSVISDIPCWSLGALINLIQPFYPEIEPKGNYLWNVSICAVNYLLSEDEGYDIHIKEKSLVDACVKTIIVLIEHNKIEKQETK